MDTSKIKFSFLSDVSEHPIVIEATSLECALERLDELFKDSKTVNPTKWTLIQNK